MRRAGSLWHIKRANLFIYLFIYNLHNQLRSTGIVRPQVTTRLTGQSLAALRIFFSKTLSDPLHSLARALSSQTLLHGIPEDVPESLGVLNRVGSLN